MNWQITNKIWKIKKQNGKGKCKLKVQIGDKQTEAGKSYMKTNEKQNGTSMIIRGKWYISKHNQNIKDLSRYMIFCNRTLNFFRGPGVPRGRLILIGRLNVFGVRGYLPDA